MMKSRFSALAVIAFALASACTTQRARPGAVAPAEVVDDVSAARRLLEQERAVARAEPSGPPAARIRRMVHLGMWPEAESLLSATPGSQPELRAAEADLRLKQHRYPEAGALVEQVLAQYPAHRGARLLRARLQIQAWQLPQAAATAQALLDEQPHDVEAALLLGRIRLLEKNYGEALRWAKQVQEWDLRHPGGYLLEADTRFWDQDPAGAEAPLKHALALDPFDPDARFSYGYAIWRRVDATQLDNMAAQWNLALELDPLHYVTHWHFGNGHTHLTYADYAHPTDSIVRVRLARADSLIAANQIPAALATAREVEREFPGSPLPAMLRASAFYMAYDVDRATRLDSAQAILRSILARKPNYGPAHNGLAAVIKQRQFTVLAKFDSLEAEIARTPLPSNPALDSVFPDARYYPGDRVRKMVRQQLGPSAAYLPLIQRQERRYRIPPLHKDLAEVMERPFFRTSTTFDNRQWMDIRGVGSGAAAIEYVERGSHQERNVLLHEYVHLFHGIVFTDAENRRVRELYHNAMREGRTLDYYASNNESEFLAQAYPAFLSPVKVHPLNHKAMNTHDDLRRKDPATYAFVDSLIAKQRAYLAGNRSALASNWAEVYVNLSENARADEKENREDRFQTAVALLDTALVWDAEYVPALLSYAALERERGRFAEADEWLARAEALDPTYAPVYAARAELAGARARVDSTATDRALEQQAALYRRALELERDLAVRAQLSQALRALYLSHARIPDAIRVAEEYVGSAPTISTYLRDRRDEAAAFAHELRSSVGYAGESLPFFRELVGQKPQNYSLRAQFADALVAAGKPDEALATLEEAQRILSAGGSANAGFMARIAEIHLARGDTAAARAAIEPILAGRVKAEADNLRLVPVLAALARTSDARERLSAYGEGEGPLARAEAFYTRGWISEVDGDSAASEEAYRAALAANPYHRLARARLVQLLARAGRSAEASALLEGARTLPLPLGPDFRAEMPSGGSPR